MAVKMMQTPDQAKTHLVGLGVRVDLIEALQTAGLSIWQIVGLIWQFGQKYGPELFTIVLGIIQAIQLGDPAKSAAALEALYVQYGADLATMAVLIASWFGVTITAKPK